MNGEKKSEPLDLKGHDLRFRSLLGEWRAQQGNRAATNSDGEIVPELMAALEHMASERAYLMAWNDEVQAVRLTRKEVRICHQRAVSQERLRVHGQLFDAKDPGQWWQEIVGVCTAWKIPAEYEHWRSKKRGEQREAA